MIDLCRNTKSDNANVVEMYITCRVADSSQSHMKQTLNLCVVASSHLAIANETSHTAKCHNNCAKHGFLFWFRVPVFVMRRQITQYVRGIIK